MDFKDEIPDFENEENEALENREQESVCINRNRINTNSKIMKEIEQERLLAREQKAKELDETFVNNGSTFIDIEPEF